MEEKNVTKNLFWVINCRRQKKQIIFLYLSKHFYIITHGMAQHNGKHTGTIAPPLLLELFDLLSASYSYFPRALAWPP